MPRRVDRAFEEDKARAWLEKAKMAKSLVGESAGPAISKRMSSIFEFIVLQDDMRLDMAGLEATARAKSMVGESARRHAFGYGRASTFGTLGKCNSPVRYVYFDEKFWMRQSYAIAIF